MPETIPEPAHRQACAQRRQRQRLIFALGLVWLILSLSLLWAAGFVEDAWELGWRGVFGGLGVLILLLSPVWMMALVNGRCPQCRRWLGFGKAANHCGHCGQSLECRK